MNPPTTLTNHNPPATIGCGLNPNPIRREESDTPHSLWIRQCCGLLSRAPRGSSAPGLVRLLVIALGAACRAEQRTCGCRKLCRGWSGGISVLVDETVTASRFHDLEVSI